MLKPRFALQLKLLRLYLERSTGAAALTQHFALQLNLAANKEAPPEQWMLRLRFAPQLKLQWLQPAFLSRPLQ
jgi:hypothetical protein